VDDRDNGTQKQKNEWAEIYGNMKNEIEDLKRANRDLSHSRGEPAASSSAGFAETAKKLKKRELECSALWETLRDMYHGGKQVYDTRALLEILALRALDTKAKRKLNLQ